MEEKKHEMSDKKRQQIMYDLSYYEEQENEARLRKEAAKLEDIRRRRRIDVQDVQDLYEKYEYYGIDVNIIRKVVTLRKPLEVKYLSQLRYDCNKLGMRFIIDAD